MVHSLESDKEWHRRIGKAGFLIEISALDVENNVLDMRQFPLFRLQEYIETSFGTPSLALNRYFMFEKTKPGLVWDKCIQWKDVVAVSGIKFRPNERLVLQYSIDHG